MTIMNWALHPRGAAIVSDTLVTHAVTDRTTHFTTKAFVVPHLGLMMCAKNWALPITNVWVALMSGAPVTGMDELLPAAVTIMRGTSAQVGPQFGDPASISYVFGWDAQERRIVGYGFDSRRDYVPEPLPYAALLTPPLTDAAGSWWDIALAQQAADRAQPAEERDNIGGWLTMHELIAPREPDGLPRIEISNLGLLPFFEEDRAAVRQEMEALHG